MNKPNDGVLDSWEHYEDKEWYKKNSTNEMTTLAPHNDVVVTETWRNVSVQDVRLTDIARHKAQHGAQRGAQHLLRRGANSFAGTWHSRDRLNKGALFNRAIDACAKQRDGSPGVSVKHMTTVGVKNAELACNNQNHRNWSTVRQALPDKYSDIARETDSTWSSKQAWRGKPGRSDKADNWRR